MSRLTAVALVLALSGSACAANYSRGDEEAVAPTTTVATKYGSPDLVPTTTTTTTTAPCDPPCEPAPGTPADRSTAPPLAVTDAPAPVNRSQKQDPSGFFLTLVTDGATTFRTSDRVAFELTFENRSDPPRTLVHDSNQTIRFALYRQADDGSWKTAWSNMKCRATLRPEERPTTGVIEVESGEKGSFIDEYPSTTESDNDCGVGAGRYLLVGFLDWCPDDAIKTSEHNDARYCDSAKVEKLQSTPLRVEFTA